MSLKKSRIKMNKTNLISCTRENIYLIIQSYYLYPICLFLMLLAVAADMFICAISVARK